jgi:endoglucanase Acf2
MLNRSVHRARRRASTSFPRRPRHRPIVETLEDRLLLASNSLTAGDHLYISDTIPTTAAGASLGTITVKVLDGAGKVITGDDTSVVQLYIENNVGGAQFRNAATEVPITTPITATVHHGVATFAGLALDKAGIGYMLGAQEVGDTAQPTTSNAFVVTAGAPTGLAFMVQPTFTDPNTIGDKGQNLTINEYAPNSAVANTWPGVVVEVVDQFGNEVTSGVSGGTVTMTATSVSAPAGMTVPFNTNATTTVSIDPNTQVAVFSNLQWNGNIGQTTPGFGVGATKINMQDPTGISNLLAKGPVGLAGPGIAPGTLITKVDSDGSIELSQPTIGTASDGATLFVNNAGTFTLTATASQPVTYQGHAVTLAPATSNPFVVSPDRRVSLGFAPGSAPPQSAGVTTALGVIKVEVLDQWNQVMTDDDTDNVVLLTGGVTGTLTQGVVDGVATFDDLAIANQKVNPSSSLLLNFQYQNMALGGAQQGVNLLPGPAYALSIVNTYVGGQVGGQVVAGAPITASAAAGGGQSAIEVDVVDAAGNVVTSDNSTIVSIGLLPNNGRGAVFVGNSTTIYTPSDPRLPAPPNNPPATPNSWDFQATAQVVKGQVCFPHLYTDYAGTGYILAAGTTSFAAYGGANTQQFTVTPAPASQLVFGNQPGASNQNSRLNFVNPTNPLLPGVFGIVVAGFDAFGNLATGFDGPVTLGLQNSTNIGGTTTINAINGFAVFQQAYITQPGTTYQLTATSANIPQIVSNPFVVNQASFPGDPVLTIEPLKTPNPKSGEAFDVTVHVRDKSGTQPLDAYDKLANLNLELVAGDGSYLPAGPFLQYIGPSGLLPTNGDATFRVKIDLPGTVTSASYQIVALMDINAQTATTAPFTVGDPSKARAKAHVKAAAKAHVKAAAKAHVKASAKAHVKASAKTSTKGRRLGATSSGIINYGLGSLTTNFGTISSLPTYQNISPGQRPYPPVQNFDPTSVPAGGPKPQQPNVAKGFDQVPQTSKFWSSLIFPRASVAPGDLNTPQDSEGHILYALNADPITAMVNSNRPVQESGTLTKGSDVVTVPDASVLTVGSTVTGRGLPAHTKIMAIDNNQITLSKDAKKSRTDKALDFPDFAGLGMSYLSSSALFIQPSNPNNDPAPPSVPVGQPPVQTNPQAPGAQSWAYNYAGDGNPREYQDFSIGLQGVQADGKVLRYSDWTVTLDWKGMDANRHEQELQATLGQGMPFVYFTVPTANASSKTTIQLVTTPKTTINPDTNDQEPAPVKVTAYDPTTGMPAQSGTGPFELEISYSVHDLLDDITQASNTTASSNEITVVDATQLAPNMSVIGNGILPNTVITSIVDNTHVDISNPANATASGVSLLFNSLAQRSFDNFYGIYLPSTVHWSFGGADDSGDTTFTATLGADNYFSVATLPGGTMGTFNPTFNTFLPHAYTFVTGSTSSFSYDPSTSMVTTTYELKTNVMQKVRGATDTGPLQALNATQYNNLTASDLQALKAFNVNGQYNYISPHGELLLWDGPTFSTQLTYTGVLPSVPPLPDGGNPLSGLSGSGDAALWNTYLLPILRSISSQPQSDGQLALDNIFPNDNNYFQAQAMYGASQLVPILLEISQSTDPGLSASDKASAYTYAELIYNAVKNRMGAWLSANDDDALQMLYYQPATAQETNAAGSPGWQSLMEILSGFLSSESLNDHQLINGYFIKVAAFLDQYDSTWGQTTQAVEDGTTNLQGKMGDIVNLLIGDVSNDDRTSKTFPFLRNFDVWDMHSWADGAANDNVGTNLESSSEALNYDSAVILWGEATGDQATTDLGISLYTDELDAVQTDWFSIKNQTDPFGHPTDVIPPQYLGSASNGTQRTLVTKLNNNGGSYVGFIGFQTSRVAGIQMLPLSGSAYYLGQDTNFVNTTYTIAQKGATAAGVIPVAPPTYQSLLLPYLALSNPTMAFSAYQTAVENNQIAPINPNNLIDNNAFNMHWIEVLDAYGQVDSSVTADIASFTVFQQPSTSVLTYVAYNPDAMAQTVQFKDASGNVLLTESVPAFTTLVSQGSGNNPTIVAEQTTPNFSLATPQNRFFFTTDNSKPTLTYGHAGGGEGAIAFDGAKNPAGTNSLDFTISGLTGTLASQNAVPDFSMWFDPETRDASQGSPVLYVTITINPGNGQPSVTEQYDNFAMSQNAGYVEYRSAQAGGLIGGNPSKSLPTQLVNGSVTVSIVVSKNISASAPVRFRTDAAAQQGRVSYLDLPYNFTTVGLDSNNKPIPVSQLSLGGQTLGPPLPDIAGTPPSDRSSRSDPAPAIIKPAHRAMNVEGSHRIDSERRQSRA